MNLKYYPDPILKTKCTEVKNFDFILFSILGEMVSIMDDKKGLGLSANQIGITQRFFIMRDQKDKLWEFINPIILESEGNYKMREGCLSAPGILKVCPRYETVVIRAQDRNGDEFKIMAVGIEAVVIQHELDHLNGISFLENK